MNFILQYELFHLFYTFFADAEQDIRIFFVEDRVDLGEHGGTGLRCVGNGNFTGAFFRNIGNDAVGLLFHIHDLMCSPQVNAPGKGRDHAVLAAFKEWCPKLLFQL